MVSSSSYSYFFEEPRENRLLSVVTLFLLWVVSPFSLKECAGEEMEQLGGGVVQSKFF